MVEEEEEGGGGAECSWIEKLYANPKANVLLLVCEIGDTLPTTNRKKKAIMRGGGTNSSTTKVLYDEAGPKLCLTSMLPLPNELPTH